MVIIMQTFAYYSILVVIIIFAPLVTIWSLNTLFPVLQIPVSVGTWFAILWLSIVYNNSNWKG